MSALKTMLLIMVTLGLALPANAERVDTRLSCLAAYGDVWGDKKSGADQVEIRKRNIAGDNIKTPDDLARAVGSREFGLKIIKGGNFAGWDLSGRALSYVCFENSNLAGANLAGVRANGAGFIGADLTGANLKNADMPYIFLRDSKLANANASGANFINGHFDGGWFKGNVAGWNIDGADLHGFTFACGITLDDGCPVFQGGDPISAQGTDFSEATLHSFNLYSVKLDGAVLANTTIGPAQLPQLAKAEFRSDIVLRGADQDVTISSEQAQAILAAHGKQKLIEARPSFDCTKASTKIEVVICEEFATDLRAMDRDVAALYKQVKAVDSNIKRSQLSWLKGRDACADEEYPSDCVSQSYSKRKGQLLGVIGDKGWLQPGQSAYFVDEVLPLTRAFKQTELYRKITPTLAGASYSEILVERQQDGLYSIKGNAVGANAHLCSLGATLFKNNSVKM